MLVHKLTIRAEKTNTQSIHERIEKCTTVADCDKLDAALNRLYHNGVISAKELKRHDKELCDKRAVITSS